MALLFLDSFDHYATADLLEKWTASGTSGGTLVVTSATGRRGSKGFRYSPDSTNRQGYLLKTLAPSDPTTIVVGFAVIIPAGTVGADGYALATIRDGATNQLTLRINSNYTLNVVRGAHNAGTVLGAATAPIAAGAYVYLEWKAVIHPSAGTVDVRVNGVSALSLTAQNTRNTAANQWTGVALGCFDVAANNMTGSNYIEYDDVYVLDGAGAAPWNAPLGDCRVDARLPTGAGASAAWTPLAGANWAAVDDPAPDDDTTYVSTTTVGALDTHVVQDAPVVGATIFGVQHCLNLKKLDAGVCAVAPVVRHSGVNYPGADLAPATSYGYLLQVAQTNPGTSAQWTEAGFNAAEFGYKRTA